MDLKEMETEIAALVGRYAETGHAPKPFIRGETLVPVAGRVYGKEEIVALVESALEFWLTTGRFNEKFEKRLAEYLGVRYALTVNSGSSANLLAVAALTSPMLGEKALKPGDEAITVAAGFPTTVNPLLLYGLVPVFVDVHIPTYNIAPGLIEEAVSERTRAIVLAHTLGNPFDVHTVKGLAEKHGLWLIEDCCDALGSTYEGRKVGTFGDLATLSFYPAHHITMGEGGAVVTADGVLKRIVESMRDWGRDCYCPPGRNNTCGKRFQMRHGDLPEGYDHKYVYSHAGFNLKITDMQAAVGVAQLDRLEHFIAVRKANFRLMKEKIAAFEEFFILPEALPGSDPSWFGFPLTLREGTPFKREDLLRYLYRNRVDSRLLFGGNLVRQPYFRGQTYRVSGSLSSTDIVMERTFWLGVYPGLSPQMIDYVAECIGRFLREKA